MTRAHRRLHLLIVIAVVAATATLVVIGPRYSGGPVTTDAPEAIFGEAP